MIILATTAHMVCCQLQKNSKIYVAGHTGLVGSAIVRALTQQGFTNIITVSSKELDLRSIDRVNDFFKRMRPEFVFLTAARVGGILANINYPAQFIYDNLLISANVIHTAYLFGVKKLLYFGSCCVYSSDCPQPIKESCFFNGGKLDEAMQSYSVAKISGVEMCRAYNKQYGTKFIACMPSNLYGYGDKFNLQTSNVMQALVAKIFEAKENNAQEVVIWGSGQPYREFLYVDDCAEACILLMQNYEGDEIVNVGSGKDISIAELAKIIAETVGYTGKFKYDTKMPDGVMKKLLNIDKLRALGWYPKVSLNDGVLREIEWYKSLKQKQTACDCSTI